MDLSEYVVVYNVAREPFTGWTMGLVGVILGAVGGLLLGASDKKVERLAGIVWVAACLVFVYYSVSSTWHEYSRLQRDFREGHFTDLEGYVEDFRHAPPGGKGPQVFFVSGHRFEIWEHEESAAFHATARGGGPNLAGHCVRLFFTEHNEIIWLAIRKSGCAAVREAAGHHVASAQPMA